MDNGPGSTGAPSQVAPAGQLLPTLRLGIVPYLNVQPLVWALERKPAFPSLAGVQVSMVPAVPRMLARGLREGQYDAAIVPVFELLQHPEYAIVPGVSISCRGPVHSVVLFSDTPLEAVRTVILDPSSLTSSHLVQVLLAERKLPVRYAVHSSADPVGTPLPPGTARLLIGDPAMACHGSHRFAYDLGAMWLDMTGKPFVFAAWLVPPGSDSLPLTPVLNESARIGQANLERVCEERAERFGSSPAEACRYFRENIRYGLGPEEADGWREFGRLCEKHRLISRAPELRFLPK